MKRGLAPVRWMFDAATGVTLLRKIRMEGVLAPSVRAISCLSCYQHCDKEASAHDDSCLQRAGKKEMTVGKINLFESSTVK